MNEINCPYCDEDGYDLIGLKHHLLNNCGVFDETISLQEERDLIKKNPPKPIPQCPNCGQKHIEEELCPTGWV